MFQFAECPFIRLYIHLIIIEVYSIRFPHSDIPAL